MPTNFKISHHPSLRCLAGEPYPLAADAAAAGFFSRFRQTERLVIQHGPRAVIGLPGLASLDSEALPGLRSAFAK
jgi:hypothetical protein